jgi:hypothetical protein
VVQGGSDKLPSHTQIRDTFGDLHANTHNTHNKHTQQAPVQQDARAPFAQEANRGRGGGFSFSRGTASVVRCAHSQCALPHEGS